MSPEANPYRNIKLTISYDGTRFAGWQVQPNAHTVQAKVESAIRAITGETADLTVAGRTDSGVHAIGQVANFRTRTNIPAAKFRPALQTKLPRDIVIRKSEEVPADFHATYDAVRKMYRYVYHNREVASPWMVHLATHEPQRLNADAMHAASQRLLGTYDFRCFESHYPNKATSVRTVMDVSVRRTSGWHVWGASPLNESQTTTADEGTMAADDGEFVVMEITADGFLYNMVRTIAGTLLRVGLGQWTADDVSRIIHSQDRSQAGSTAPPQGLYLVFVDYPNSEIETAANASIGEQAK